MLLARPAHRGARRNRARYAALHLTGDRSTVVFGIYSDQRTVVVLLCTEQYSNSRILRNGGTPRQRGLFILFILTKKRRHAAPESKKSL
jgi:hypothetical protein